MGQPGTQQSQRIRSLQIVSFAMMQGIVIFGGIAIWLTLESTPDDKPILVWVGIGLAVVAVVIRTILGNYLPTGFRHGIDRTVWDELPARNQDETLIGNLQTKQIIEFAVLEGAAFINLLFYVFEKQTFSLVVAGVLLGLMAIAFPTNTKVDQWIDTQRQSINFGS